MEDLLARDIQNFCIAHRLRLSLAESCTGGNVAARLTRIPGCSHYFLGSIVAYSDEMKVKVLGVDKKILSQFGAVSGPVVSQMARGALQMSESDYSVAISGIAGPGGATATKPVGTMWAAIARKGEDPFVWDFYLSGTRVEIIEQSTEILLKHFYDQLGK